MNGQKINNAPKELRILIAPLDWGLGHATRCIPIIYALQKAGAALFLACDGATENLLKKEFPTFRFLHLKGYQVQYARRKQLFLWRLFAQLPRIRRTIRYEQRWLQKVVQEHEIDGVISDNRFGLYHGQIPCVYITHQLQFKTGSTWLNSFAQKIHYKFINRFSECWVPDAAGEVNLAGRLSHPDVMPKIPVRYLGNLSRFTKTESLKTVTLLVILSGPEPQRSIFETLIISQLQDFDGKVVLVRGLPSVQSVPEVASHIHVVNHLTANELCKLALSSEMVLARAGYSTIMDLAQLHQKAILVPTPSQAEQEYLACYLGQLGLFYTCNQQKFNLPDALKKAIDFYSLKQPWTFQPFHEDIVIEWLQTVRRTKA